MAVTLDGGWCAGCGSREKKVVYIEGYNWQCQDCLFGHVVDDTIKLQGSDCANCGEGAPMYCEDCMSGSCDACGEGTRSYCESCSSGNCSDCGDNGEYCTLRCESCGGSTCGECGDSAYYHMCEDHAATKCEIYGCDNDVDTFLCYKHITPECDYCGKESEGGYSVCSSCFDAIDEDEAESSPVQLVAAQPYVSSEGATFDKEGVITTKDGVVINWS
jgi:hypothetical protein